MMSVPVMSDGIRSGVNWMRLKTRPRVCAMVRTSSVLAVPGRPVIRQWPPTNSAISTCSRTSSWPTITRRTCVDDLRSATSRKRAMRGLQDFGFQLWRHGVDMMSPVLFLAVLIFRSTQFQQQSSGPA